MKRPAVRLLLTLAIAASVLGVVPATSEAGIIPWAWDTIFGPVGSIQARRVARYNGYGAGCCGPAAPTYAGFRGGWGGYSGGCCAPSCNSCGGGGCNSCGAGGYASGGCSSCGTGYAGGYYDGSYGGYGQSACGAGGCANGQCNVNYPPGQTPAAGGPSTVTPAPAPAPVPNAAGTGPSPAYDNRTAPPAPMGSNDNFMPPVTPAPAPNGADSTDGFKPTQPRSPAPNSVDPTQNDQNYVPPKVTPPAAPATGDTEPTDAGIPPVPAPVPKKPKFSEDDDDKASIGPRFELNEKVTWRPTVQRTRTALTAVRVSASAHRYGLFAKTAWRSGTETELAKK